MMLSLSELRIRNSCNGFCKKFCAECSTRGVVPKRVSTGFDRFFAN